MATETQESRPGKNPWNQCWNQHVDPRGHLIILKGLGSCQRVNPGDRRGSDAIALTDFCRVQSHFQPRRTHWTPRLRSLHQKNFSGILIILMIGKSLCQHPFTRAHPQNPSPRAI
ncbi:hypothetical protein [Laspinema olomoucense]|uniref:Uncharacterized protein n=1 Tax=Laspinema olomoucense D3b TaxID=2953688 RepID=A0ABT2NC29_9CYAN|nr:MULTISPECIES: hypothetical protein [unclassified Laspinema]MCT7971355.1 hypothetical protein [Laspinema sp. D3d]MCT7979424.1 hypothetical protein [Laspinema sp. D3b]